MSNLLLQFKSGEVSKWICISLLLFFSILYLPVKGQNNWIFLDSLPSSPRVFAAGFSIGSSGYIGGGSFDASTVIYQDFWEYNITTNVWTQKANLPAPRMLSFSFSINGKGYIGGGWDSPLGAKSEFYEYDPFLNTWTQKANFGGGYNYFSSGFSIGNFGYVVCGVDSTTYQTNDFWQYNPISDQWVLKSPFPAASRIGPAVFTIGNNAYVATGIDFDNDSACSDMWEYNSVLDAWSQKANYPDVGAYFPVSFSAFGKGFIGAGFDMYNMNSSPNRLYEYDPVNDSWRVRAAIVQLGYNHYSGVYWSINNRCFAATGMISHNETTFLREYIPDTVNTGCAANYYLYADTIPQNYLVNNLATGVAPMSYLWDWGDGSTSVGPLPTHAYLVPGIYTICQTVTDANGCVDTYCDSSFLYRLSLNALIVNVTVVSVLTGTEEIVPDVKVFCYPNPSNSLVHVLADDLIKSYRLLDMNGKTVEARDVNDFSFDLSIENLPDATYIFQIETLKGIQSRRISKF